MAAVPNGITTLGSDKERDYSFSGSISEGVLQNYLSRAITMSDILIPTGQPYLHDNIYMLVNTGAKFVGRAVFTWGRESQVVKRLPLQFLIDIVHFLEMFPIAMNTNSIAASEVGNAGRFLVTLRISAPRPFQLLPIIGYFSSHTEQNSCGATSAVSSVAAV